MKLWSFLIFNENFLNSQYRYVNECVDDVIASNILSKDEILKMFMFFIKFIL